ncbi:hypothetical protein [Cytophaga aurantiaca]|uniref:hypothetical protein n=1 Tax=Cytophaga aurantiaca TaxID=29530 RepID=UPI00035D1E8A|nr:hypothetical protein [Cytophaga aurantiaca]
MKKSSSILIFFVVCLIVTVSSCVPDSMKKEMDANMKAGQQMFADQEFKKALGAIELHKLRNGKYPASLTELQYLGSLDATLFQFVEYKSMDSVYELNVKYEYPSFSNETKNKITLKYPKEFWKGLGCAKSNAMQ